MIDMNSKILYVGKRVHTITGGADQVNKRNQWLLEQTSRGNVVYAEPKSISRWSRFSFGIDNEFLKEIKGIISAENISLVFMSGSLLGKVTKFIREQFPNVRIMTFFHNVEAHYAKSFVKTTGYRAIPFYLMVRYWEKICCHTTTDFITLNQRDAKLLKKIYGVNAATVLPTTFSDSFNLAEAERVENEVMNNEITPPQHTQIDYLFVGRAFFANVEGVQWFINNVLPSVDGHLWVVGSNMDKVSLNNVNERVHLVGHVDDLSYYYYKARMVVSPIFSGGGMKTKTAEALMYGKNILGSVEAFEGYNIDDRCMTLCNTAYDFITAIQEMKNKPLTNPFAREIFKKYYSDDVLLEKVQHLLDTELKNP